jgi:PKD repeat protein
MRKRLERLVVALLAMVLVLPALADIPQSEHDALMALYNATGGANWIFNVGWDGALGTENTWDGVVTDEANTTVVGLLLVGNNLVGSIPPEIGNLPNLEYLDLSTNELSGSVPSQISSCTKLKSVYLFRNHLSGTVPAQLGSLSQLEELFLGYNRFTGQVPAELGSLAALKYLFLESNALSGELPSQLSNLTNLVTEEDNNGGLDLRYNALTTSNTTLKDFLDSKQRRGNWTSYQTVAPDGLTAYDPTSSSLEVSWNTIDYVEDSGYYALYQSTTPGGPYTLAGSTSDKYDHYVQVTGLSASTTYYFVVKAVTTADTTHNQNTIESHYSAEASGTTEQGAAPLTVTASANPTMGAAPLEVQFSFVYSGGTGPIPKTVSWTFGDGGTSTEQAPKHTYTTTGTFAVGLTITDSQNQTASDNTLQITTSPPCTLSCSATVPTHAPPGTEVSFQSEATATGCAGTPAFAWAFGDGSTSTEQNPKHTYATAGDYIWSLGVSVSDKVCTQTGSIEVLLPPTLLTLKKMGNPFRIKITGSNFQTGVKVYINGAEWTNFKLKSPNELLLKGGGTLKAAVPKNTPTQFRVANPDGGEATTTWQWP